MIFGKRIPATQPSLSPEERKRRKREAVLSVAIVITVAVLTFIENRVITFGTEIPVSNTILMFILININLLLLILLIFLVFRNLVKLLYTRRRRVMGAQLRTRLVMAFVALSLLPTIILFFPDLKCLPIFNIQTCFIETFLLCSKRSLNFLE